MNSVNCFLCGEDIERTAVFANDEDGMSWHHFFNRSDVKKKLDMIFDEPRTDAEHFRKQQLNSWIWNNMPKFPIHRGCHDKMEHRLANHGKDVVEVEGGT